MKDHLRGLANQKARAAAAESIQWLDDAAGKVDWCGSLNDDVDRDGIETRRLAIADMCSAWADGESLRADALKHIALAARAASDAAERDNWLRQAEDLENKWNAISSQLNETR